MTAAVLALALAGAAGGLKKPPNPEEIFNPLLGVEYAHWLGGPIYHLATEAEVEEFLQLASDEEAERFVAGFWERRNAGTEVFQKTPEQIFAQRAEQADSRYGEGSTPGRRSDRGTVFILYGDPEETDFESPQERDAPPQEVWRYPKKGRLGLDGQKPKRSYRFVKVRGTTVFYSGWANSLATRDRKHTRRPF